MAVHDHAQSLRQPLAAHEAARPHLGGRRRGRARSGAFAAGEHGTPGCAARACYAHRGATADRSAGCRRRLSVRRGGCHARHSGRNRDVAPEPGPRPPEGVCGGAGAALAAEGEMTAIERPIGEDELHAYVDGFLGPERRLTVERYLGDHADAAARIAGWQAVGEALRNAAAWKFQEPVPAALNIARLAEARIAHRWGPWRIAASV